MRGTRIRRLGLLLAAALLSAGGCATLSEADLERRDYRRSDFRNQFIDDRALCHARGGRMYIDAKQTLGRDGIPRRGDRYFCA